MALALVQLSGWTCSKGYVWYKVAMKNYLKYMYYRTRLLDTCCSVWDSQALWTHTFLALISVPVGRRGFSSCYEPLYKVILSRCGFVLLELDLAEWEVFIALVCFFSLILGPKFPTWIYVHVLHSMRYRSAASRRLIIVLFSGMVKAYIKEIVKCWVNSTKWYFFKWCFVKQRH